MVRKLPSLDNQIAEISVHTALQTPHKFVHVPHVHLPTYKQDGAGFYDVRICELCLKGEKLVGRFDRIWSDLGPIDTLRILKKYKAYLRGSV